MPFSKYLNNEKSNNIYFDAFINKNADTAIIFIHGIVGSRRYWDKTYQELSKHYSLYFIDLLGFGLSAKPKTAYTLQKHTAALKQFIDKEVTEKNLILVGHSLGAHIALAYVNFYPENIEKAIIISLPYYLSSEEAMMHVKAYIKPQYFVVDTPFTKLTCTLWCYFGGPVTRKITPYLLKNTPKPIASDSLLHTYNSYISTLYNVIYNQNISSLFSKAIRKKLIFVHGERDRVAPLEHIQKLAQRYNFKLITVPNGTHTLPLSSKETIISLLK